MRRILVSFLAFLLTTCAANVPTGPAPETTREGSTPSNSEASSRSAHADWLVEVLRAPANGQKLKVNKQGKLPQPAPQFRFKATPPVDVPEGTFTLLFLTAGSKACGIATARGSIAFAVNEARTIDIRNDAIVVGPDACAIADLNCKASQCRLPLTTKKLRIVFGNGVEDVGEVTASREYTWSNSTPASGGDRPSLTCGGQPAPDTVACGVPVARCVTGGYACSDILPCLNRGSVICYVCPGPLCCRGPGPICQE